MDNDISQIAGALIGEIRAEIAYQQLSQQELSERIKVTPAVLNRYMKGHRDMRLGTYFKISEALGLPPERLMVRAAERTK